MAHRHYCPNHVNCTCLLVPLTRTHAWRSFRPVNTFPKRSPRTWSPSFHSHPNYKPMPYRRCTWHLLKIQHKYVTATDHWSAWDLPRSSQQALVRVGVWCIGEFGDLLIANTPSSGEDGEESIKVSEDDVVNLMRAIMKNPVTTTLSKKFLLTSLLKLSSRFSGAQQE